MDRSKHGHSLLGSDIVKPPRFSCGSVPGFVHLWRPLGPSRKKNASFHGDCCLSRRPLAKAAATKRAKTLCSILPRNLFSQPQPANDLLVSIPVLARQVLEQLIAAADELEQPAA